MKQKLLNRESDYFNNEDYFITLDSCGKSYVTKCQWYNGAWYSLEGLQYKMTSVLSCSVLDFLGAEITYPNTELKGKITKFMKPFELGINWYQGQNYKKYGMPYYWNNINDLELWNSN